MSQLQPWDPKSANETCDCLTGPRDCFEAGGTTTVTSVAVVGGLTPIDDPVDQVTGNWSQKEYW